MSTREHLEERAARAKALASSEPFGEPEQLSWASLPRAPHEQPSVRARCDLTHALIDSIERQACCEFVCCLLLDGANPRARSDEDIPLWKAAIMADASRLTDESEQDFSGWAVLASMSFGPDFLRDPRLPALRLACQECIAELRSHLLAQDAHFSDEANLRRCGELYSMIEARHDGAFGLLAAQTSALASQIRPGRQPD
jgi:hypothetical protein